jgi:hypothetical protein
VHVVAIRLRIRPHEAIGIDQRLLALGQLRNAVVRDARKRALAMKEDTRWRTNMEIVDPKERALAYKKLRREYDVGEFAARELACVHWQRSQWMAKLIDRRSANALGSEVWQSVAAWLYAGAGRPRTQHPREREVAWGNDMNGGSDGLPPARSPASLSASRQQERAWAGV